MTQHDPSLRASAWLVRLSDALEQGDTAGAGALFATESYWRDLLAFTWNVKTMEGREAIRAMLDATNGAMRPSSFAIDGLAWTAEGRTEAWFTFETAVARCRGHLRLDGDQCYTLLTTMAELKGYEEHIGPRRSVGSDRAAVGGRQTWTDRRRAEEAELGHKRQPYAVIIGGGQGGIALGARLRRLGVPALIVERNARPGDSWRNRYRSLVLHDPVWYDHLPYLPFPDDWPVFTPKDKLGDWLEAYVKVMEIPYWGSTECLVASYDAAAMEWAVSARHEGVTVVLRPKVLVLATGAYGLPNVPRLPGMEAFKGEQLHSSAFQTGAKYKGKRAVVIGSNTSANDICLDLWESGADVTMIQRSSTLVVRSETLMDLGFGDLYSERALAAGITTEAADLLFASVPFAIAAERAKAPTRAMAELDADLLARLAKAGFHTDLGYDGSGLSIKASRTGSGYYIDVGASELIANGDIKVRSQVQPRRFSEGAVVLSDRSELPADLVIWATGYQSTQATIANLIGPEVAERIGHCWGYGSGTPGDPGPWEGEIRNFWKPVAQEGLFLHGGNLHQSRFFSRFVALQIKARMEGIPTPVYGAPS